MPIRSIKGSYGFSCKYVLLSEGLIEKNPTLKEKYSLKHSLDTTDTKQILTDLSHALQRIRFLEFSNASIGASQAWMANGLFGRLKMQIDFGFDESTVELETSDGILTFKIHDAQSLRDLFAAVQKHSGLATTSSVTIDPEHEFNKHKPSKLLGGNIPYVLTYVAGGYRVKASTSNANGPSEQYDIIFDLNILANRYVTDIFTLLEGFDLFIKSIVFRTSFLLHGLVPKFENTPLAICRYPREEHATEYTISSMDSFATCAADIFRFFPKSTIDHTVTLQDRNLSAPQAQDANVSFLKGTAVLTGYEMKRGELHRTQEDVHEAKGCWQRLTHCLGL